MLLKVPLLAKWRLLRKARQAKKDNTATSRQNDTTAINGGTAADILGIDSDASANNKPDKDRRIEAECASPTMPSQTEHFIVLQPKPKSCPSKDKSLDDTDQALLEREGKGTCAHLRQNDQSQCGEEPITGPSLLLTALPRELRDQVYDVLWSDIKDLSFQHHKIFVHVRYGAKPSSATHTRSSKNNSSLPRWLLTNKQLLYEALEQLYRNAWFSTAVATAKHSRTPGLLSLDQAKKLELAIELRGSPIYQSTTPRRPDYTAVHVDAAYSYAKYFARIIRPSMTELSITFSFSGIKVRRKENVHYHLGFLTRGSGSLPRQWNRVEFGVDENTLERYWERPDWYVEQFKQLSEAVARRGRKLVGGSTCEQVGNGCRVLREGMVGEEMPADAVKEKWRVVVYRRGY